MIAQAPALASIGTPRHHYVAFPQLLCYALFACAFNLLIGFVGLLSFGHAAFWGTAAYASAHFASKGFAIGTITIFKVAIPINIAIPPFPPEFAIIAGVVVAAVFGYIIGKLAIRRLGIYFAMVTLAFAQMIFFLAVQAPFTGGEDGLQLGNASRLALGVLNLRDNL